MSSYFRALSKHPRPAGEREAERRAEAEEHDADPDEVDAAQDRYEATLSWKRDQA